MNEIDLSRKNVARVVMEAIKLEGLSQKQAAEQLNICETYILFMKNDRDLDKIPKAPWDRVVAWMVSGKSLVGWYVTNSDEGKAEVIESSGEPYYQNIFEVVMDYVKRSRKTNIKVAKDIGIPGYVISHLKNTRTWKLISKTNWGVMEKWVKAHDDIVKNEYPLTPEEAIETVFKEQDECSEMNHDELNKERQDAGMTEIKYMPAPEVSITDPVVKVTVHPQGVISPELVQKIILDLEIRVSIKS